MKRLPSVAAFALGLMMLLPVDAEAACSITTTGVNFGSYNVFSSAPVDSTGSVRYQCSGATVLFTISLTRGSSDTFEPRTMTSGGNTLQYNLYRDAARTTIWGDNTGGTSWFVGTSLSGKPVTLTVYGRIPPGQDAAAGAYSDSIIVTIQF